MRTTKAAAYLLLQEAAIRDELAAVNATCKALQMKLEMVLELRNKLAETPSRVKKRGKPVVVPATAPAPAGDGAATAA